MARRISENVILIWTGTNAGIPDGYTRETSLDSKHLKVIQDGNTNPNSASGSNTHSHTSPAHSHTLNAHTHTISLNTSTTGREGGSGSNSDAKVHGHSQVNSGAIGTGGTLSSVASTYVSTNHEPEYYEVIFIKSQGTKGIPDDAVCLWAGSTVPSGFTAVSAMDDKYLKGAGAGSDAGGTDGNATHSHTISHTHTETGHTHSSVQSGGATATVSSRFTPPFGIDGITTHTHPVSLNSNTVGYSGTPTSGTVSNDPAYKKITPIQNTSGNWASPVTGVIGLWLGNISDIPRGWSLITTYYSKYLKMTDTVGEIGNTGGSNSHTHSDSHSHTGGSHTHTATVSTFSNNDEPEDGNGNQIPSTHSHSATVGSASPNWSNENTTADSSSNELAHRTVALIQHEVQAQGASSLFLG